MKLEDLVLVRMDDHVVEPPHVFEGGSRRNTPTPRSQPSSALAAVFRAQRYHTRRNVTCPSAVSMTLPREATNRL